MSCYLNQPYFQFKVKRYKYKNNREVYFTKVDKINKLYHIYKLSLDG